MASAISHQNHPSKLSNFVLTHRFVFFKRIILPLLFCVLYTYCTAQRITDYLSGYAYPTTNLSRQPLDNSASSGRQTNGNHRFETDGKSIYYIINSIGDSKFESYVDDIYITEPTFKDTFNSQLVFLKYELTTKKFTAKTFGSNYFNLVYKVQMDEDKRSICTVISTCGDSVYLNPANPDELLKFPNRLRRFWLLNLDLNGQLLSKCLLAESAYSLALPLITHNLGVNVLGKFNYLGNIIISFFPDKDIVKLLPGQFHDSVKFENNKPYIACFNTKNLKIEWLRKIERGKLILFSYNMPNVNYMLAFNLNRRPNITLDSVILIKDAWGKITDQYDFQTEKIKDNHVMTKVFKIGDSGKMEMVISFDSRDHETVSPRTVITSNVQNGQDMIATIRSADTVTINGKSFIGEVDKHESTSKSNLPVRYLLLKIKLNTSKFDTYKITNSADSVVPLRIIKGTNGFYVLYTYDNKSSSFNILPSDTIVNFRDDKTYLEFRLGDYNTLCSYDSNYKLKWLHKSSSINSIYDFGSTLIFDYAPNTAHDFDFKPESIFEIKPMPVLIAAGIYDCKPIAYFDTTQKGNTIRFINLSEYNVSYKWDFGDGTTPTQKSPSHFFKSNNNSYKTSLIVTNTCGSDTFIRYFKNTVNINKFGNSWILKIYPNPVNNDILFIENPANVELNSVKLYNTLGQQIENFSIEKIGAYTYALNLKHVSQGIYFFKAVSNDNSDFISKLIIQ